MTVRELMDKLRDYNDDVEIRFWGGVEDVYITSDEHCLCYRADWIYNGTGFVKKPVCLGTQECDPCSCDGHKRNCNFYEHYRNDPVEDNIIHIRPVLGGFERVWEEF